MTYVDDLLIVGEQQEQESFITKLAAHNPLKHKTKLDAKTPLTFLGKTLEHKASEHSINLHLPASYYMKLFKMYGMENAKTTSTTGDKLGQSDDPGILSIIPWIKQDTSFTEQQLESYSGLLPSDQT